MGPQWQMSVTCLMQTECVPEAVCVCVSGAEPELCDAEMSGMCLMQVACP